MNGKRIAIVILGAALVAGVVLLFKSRKPAESTTPVAQQAPPPQGQPYQPPPKPILPVATDGGAPRLLSVPPGTTIATPLGDPNPPIPVAPRGERIIRDHRGQNDPPPVLKVTPQGITAAGAAIKPAVASCLNGPVTLQFTLTMSGGRAQVQDPKLMNAAQQPEAQACVEKALAKLSWNTPDPDGSTPVTMPLISSSNSKN